MLQSALRRAGRRPDQPVSNVLTDPKIAFTAGLLIDLQNRRKRLRGIDCLHIVSLFDMALRLGFQKIQDPGIFRSLVCPVKALKAYARNPIKAVDIHPPFFILFSNRSLHDPMDQLSAFLVHASIPSFFQALRGR